MENKKEAGAPLTGGLVDHSVRLDPIAEVTGSTITRTAFVTPISDVCLLPGMKLYDEVTVKHLRRVVTACWGALLELSPCAHGECKQPQTEALDLAMRMADKIVRPNISEDQDN